MKTTLLTIFAGLLAGWFSQQQLQAKELKDIKVLYIGSERTGEFVPFLKKHVAEVESRKRSGFNVADAEDFPIERVWADRNPDALQPIYGTAEGDRLFRIYRVVPEGSVREGRRNMNN